jgi:hypothetical protein
VKTRQLVCGDPEVLKRLPRFVPTVGNPEAYRETKNRPLEYRLVHDAMMQTEFADSMKDWHVQGLYIITPSGKLIGGRNTVTNVSAAVEELDKGLARYAKLSREERLLPKAPDPDRDRITPAAETLRPPADGLILRMVSRGLSSQGITKDDTRHEFFYKLDRVWYTKEESSAFLPPVLKTGSKEAVKRSVLKRLVLLNIGVFVQPNLYWQQEDIKEAALTAEVTGIKGDTVELRYTGRARMESSSNRRQFDGDLLGKAVFKLKTQTFSSFELLAVGQFTLGPQEGAQEGSPRTTPMGILFTLNGKNANDQVPPTHYRLYRWASGD